MEEKDTDVTAKDVEINQDGSVQDVQSPVEQAPSDTASDGASPEVNNITPPPEVEPEQAESIQVKVEPKEEPALVDSPLDEPVATEPTEAAPVSNPFQSTIPESAPAAVGVAASQMGKAPHRNNKKLAAVVTILVALLLAGTAVFVYMSANSNTEEAESTNDSVSNQQSTPETEATPASTEDLDATAKEVEDAVKSLDETEDFAEEDLADDSLGL